MMDMFCWSYATDTYRSPRSYESVSLEIRYNDIVDRLHKIEKFYMHYKLGPQNEVLANDIMWKYYCFITFLLILAIVLATRLLISESSSSA